MTFTEVFLCGAGGSFVVELAALHQVYGGKKPKLPDRYCLIGFWVTRLLMVVVAGLLPAYIYEVNTKLLAANIGASAPLLIMELARGVKRSI
jgi:hypothetical protein